MRSNKFVDMLFCAIVLAVFFAPVRDIIEHSHFVHFPDTMYNYYPFRDLFIHYLKQGTFLLWNPYIGAGMPALPWGNLPIDVLTVADYIFPERVFRNSVEFTFLVCLFMLLACVPLFRLLKLSRAMSLLFGILYFESTWVVVLAHFPFNAASFIFMPLIMWSIIKYHEKGRTFYALLCMLFLSLSFFSKANLWVYNLAWTLITYLLVWTFRGKHSASSEMPFRQAILWISLILLVPILLNLGQITAIRNLHSESNRVFLFSSLRNLGDWELFWLFIRSVADSPLVRIIGIITSTWLLLARVLRVSIICIDWKLLAGLCVLLFIYCPAPRSVQAPLDDRAVRTFYFITRLGETYFLPSIALFASVVAFLAPNRKLRIPLNLLGTWCLGTMILLYYYYGVLLWKFDNHWTEPFFLYLLFLMLLALTIREKPYLLKVSLASIAILIFIQSHLQYYLIDVLGIVWFPDRGYYLGNLTALLLIGYGQQRLGKLGRLGVKALGRNYAQTAAPSWVSMTLAHRALSSVMPLVIFIGCISYGREYWEKYYNPGLSLLESMHEEIPKQFAFASGGDEDIFRTYLFRTPQLSFPDWSFYGNFQTAKIFDPAMYESLKPKRYSDLVNSFAYEAGTGFLPDYPGFEPSVVVQFKKLIQRHFPEFKGQPAGFYEFHYVNSLVADPKTLHPNLLRLLNIKFIVAPADIPFENLETFPRRDPEDVKRLKFLRKGRFNGTDISVWSVENYLPRAFIVDYTRVSSGRNETLKELHDRTFDPGVKAVIEKNIGLPDSESPMKSLSTARISHYAPQRIEIDTELLVDGLLVLTDAYTSNWNVYVDGKRGDLIPTDHAFRGVKLEPGRHKVVFTYEIPYFVSLWLFAFLGYAVLVTMILRSAIIGRLRKSTTPT